MARLFPAGGLAIQKKPTMCTKMFHERKSHLRKHSGGLAGHFGTDKTYEQLSHFYYWPKMRIEVDNFVNN